MIFLEGREIPNIKGHTQNRPPQTTLSFYNIHVRAISDFCGLKPLITFNSGFLFISLIKLKIFILANKFCCHINTHVLLKIGKGR